MYKRLDIEIKISTPQGEIYWLRGLIRVEDIVELAPLLIKAQTKVHGALLDVLKDYLGAKTDVPSNLAEDVV